MPIPPTSCLYFPDMVFDDVPRPILAKLILCWEQIFTIVPAELEFPDKSDVETELFDLGIRRYQRVSPYTDEVRLAGAAVSSLIDQNAVRKILSVHGEDYTRLYDRKFGDEIRRALNYGKLPSTFADLVGRGRGQYWKVTRQFASAYMSVLAKYTADLHNQALVTAEEESYALSDIAALGDAPLSDPGDHEPIPKAEEGTHRSGAAFLHQFLIRDLRIDPEVPLRKLIEFRRRYPAEVARYRDALREAVSDPEVLAAVEEKDVSRLADWERSKIAPVMSDLRAAMHGFNVAAVMDNFTKISTVGIPMAAVGLGVPPEVAIGGQVLLSITTSTLKLKNDRRQALSGKPFAYLYKLREKFGG